jgi:hypothetical protein
VVPARLRAPALDNTRFVGNFEVRELAWGADGLERAWMLWENHCDPRGPAGFGEIRYRMPEPAGLGIAPAVPRFPDTEPGRRGPAMPVTVQAKSGPTTLAASQIAGPDAGTFAIVADGCAGVRLEPGATCEVTVTTTQRSPGVRRATLRIADSGAAVREVPLQAFQWGGVTRLDLQGDPGGFIGQGMTLSFTPVDTHLGIVRQGTDYVDDYGDSLFMKTYHDERPWEGSFSAAENNLLEVGRRYAPVELWDKPGRTEAGLWVSPRGFACDDVTGEFTLHRLRLEHDIVREASLSFVQLCEGAPPALRGTFQYRVGDDTAPPPWMVTQPSVTDLDAPSPPAVGGPAPPPRRHAVAARALPRARLRGRAPPRGDAGAGRPARRSGPRRAGRRERSRPADGPPRSRLPGRPARRRPARGRARRRPARRWTGARRPPRRARPRPPALRAGTRRRRRRRGRPRPRMRAHAPHPGLSPTAIARRVTPSIPDRTRMSRPPRPSGATAPGRRAEARPRSSAVRRPRQRLAGLRTMAPAASA